MLERELTIKEALKFARHDFLNDLQIVLMHLDMGNISQAKNTIMETTEEMKQLAMLETLGLPKTEQWIMTFDWCHTAFHKTLICDITRGIRKVDDFELVAYLSSTFNNVEKVLDPMSEYEVSFDIQATEHDWVLKITIAGTLPENMNTKKTDEKFFVKELNSHNLWTFTISGQ